RRHTSSTRDWSSDVCSSDLLWLFPYTHNPYRDSRVLKRTREHGHIVHVKVLTRERVRFTLPQSVNDLETFINPLRAYPQIHGLRSEERRVGKACTSTRGTMD